MLVVLRPRGTRACTARGNQRGSIAPVGWPRQLQWADGNAWTLILLSSPTTFVDKGWERLLLPGSPVGAVPVGPMYQSRSWPSEHLRSNRCEDAVGLSSCQTSENFSSTTFVNRGKRKAQYVAWPVLMKEPWPVLLHYGLPALLGLVAGVVGSLVAPWVHWTIERRRVRLHRRQQLIEDLRYALSTYSAASLWI